MVNTSATGGYLLQNFTNNVADDALANAFQEMIVGVTGLDATLVRPSWQPQPPTQPSVMTDWCGVAVHLIESFDYPQMIFNKLYRNERIDLIISFYGPNSLALASALRDGIYVPQNYYGLSSQGIKLRSADNIVYFPELINSQYIPRADLPMNFYRMVQRTYPIECLVGAEVQITADNGDSVLVNISQEN